jgi:hypothetical protein
MNSTKLTILATLSLVSLAPAEVKITVDSITDTRTKSEFSMSGLEVSLKLTGSELLEAKGMKLTITEAKDDTGKDISKASRMSFDSDGFSSLEKKFGFSSEKKADEFEHRLNITSPARAAKTAKITGTLELLIPAKDPASVITVDLAKEAGKPLENAALKAAGVTLNFNAPKDSEASYKLADSKGVVASVEFCTPDGKVLETSGRSSSSFGGGPKNISVSLQDKAPAGMIAKVYVVTPKSVISVPLRLDSIELP